MPKVMIRPSDYFSCQEAVDRAFELFPLKVKGKKVLVKPNAVMASNPDEAIVTHPAVIRAVVNKLETLAPAEIIVGDNPGFLGYGINEKTFQQTGLLEAAKGHYRNIGTEALEVNFSKKFGGRLSLSKDVLEADIIISVPKFKTHGLTIITGGIKNSYGFIPGAHKAMLHRVAGNALRFMELLIDVFQVKVPDLYIVDAVVGMEGNGPNCSDLREIGLILASNNGVAVDAVIARMMGLDPGAVPFIRIAQEKGLGSYARETLEIEGALKPIPGFKLPPAARDIARKKTGDSFFFTSSIRLRPRVDRNRCQACERCIEQCPVSALSMADGFPQVDAERCITCFCCQEMCPEKAIHLY
jgi:uncharacterized protein (DUF362 family)/Pyruvate/2-oxoacid:ferredoxin oxidoreductase delta subunit